MKSIILQCITDTDLFIGPLSMLWKTEREWKSKSPTSMCVCMCTWVHVFVCLSVACSLSGSHVDSGCQVTHHLPCFSIYGHDSCSDCTPLCSFIVHLLTSSQGKRTQATANSRLTDLIIYRYTEHRYTHIRADKICWVNLCVLGAAYLWDGERVTGMIPCQ